MQRKSFKSRSSGSRTRSGSSGAGKRGAYRPGESRLTHTLDMGLNERSGTSRPRPSSKKTKGMRGQILQLTPERIDTREQAFYAFWKELFTTSPHLDSALSKRQESTKAALALFAPLFLRNPASLCEGLGVGIPANEPWSLDPKELAEWPPAFQAMGRFLELRKTGLPFPGFEVVPQPEDFPRFMREEWQSEWGKEITSRLVDVLGREAPLSLRASVKLGPDGLIKALKKEGELPVRIEKSTLSPLGVVLSGFMHVLKSELFTKGAFEIQDEGSQVMALFALWPELFKLEEAPGVLVPGEMPQVPESPPAWTVVDACAGAGGKSLALADVLGGKGRVYAYDTSAGKLMALRRRAKRGGYNNIQTVAVDEGHEAKTVSKFRRRADVVLVDAPCSGWGVLRRNPDIKWHRYADITVEESARKMPGIQGRLLDLYSDLVAPGGRLVYGVCTFRKSETLEVVEQFLKSHPDFVRAQGGYLGPGSSDGFFMQALVRNKGGK